MIVRDERTVCVIGVARSKDMVQQVALLRKLDATSHRSAVEERHFSKYSAEMLSLSLLGFIFGYERRPPLVLWDAVGRLVRI